MCAGRDRREPAAAVSHALRLRQPLHGAGVRISERHGVLHVRQPQCETILIYTAYVIAPAVINNTAAAHAFTYTVIRNVYV